MSTQHDSTHHPAKDHPRCLLQGIDSLYVSYWADLPGLDWDELGFQKERSRADGKEFGEIDLGGFKWALMPYGKKPYSFVLTGHHLTLMLSENMRPNLHVQFASEGLWLEGVDTLVNRIPRFVDALGGRFTRPESISRLDMAFDFDMGKPDFEADHIVTRAGKDSQWRKHGTIETLTFGKGDIVVRLYNKVAEIEDQSGKAFFFDLWSQKENVWRVELQVRGERLKTAGIVSLPDLDLMGDLAREIAINHTSLRRPNGDSNRSRWPLHPLWQSLLTEIDNLDQTGLVSVERPGNSIEYRVEKQLQSFYGSLKGLTASLVERDKWPFVPDLETILEELPRLLRDKHSNVLWDADINDKIKARGYGL